MSAGGPGLQQHNNYSNINNNDISNSSKSIKTWNTSRISDVITQDLASRLELATVEDVIRDVTAATASTAGVTSTGGGATVYGPCRWVNVSTQVTSPWLMVSPLCSTRYQSVGVFAAVSVVMGAITLWTVLGNVLVLLALCRYTTLRTMSNCLIGNLAVSDLLLALTVLPISATNDLLGFWVFGEVMCTFWLCVDVLYCTASIWGLCTVAFDRYMATVYPVWYHDRRSVHKALACIVFVWIFSAVISLAPFIGWRHTLSNFFSFNTAMQRHECVLFTSSSYVLYSAMGSFVIPACLMTFMYIRIFVVLHGKSKGIIKRKLAGGSGGSGGGNGSATASAPQHINNNHYQHQSGTSNGCGPPGLYISDRAHTGNGVERDFTTTTLVSVTLGSMCNLDNEADEEDQMESKTLLDVPSQPEVCNPCRLQLPYCAAKTPSVSLPANLESEEHQLIPGDGCISNTAISHSPHSARRSNSIASPDGAASSLELQPHASQSTHLDLERRHSHNVAFSTSAAAGEHTTPGLGAQGHAAAAPHSGRFPGFRSTTQRSLSVNILTSGPVASDMRRRSAQPPSRPGGALSFLSISLPFPRRSVGYACAEGKPRLLDRNSRLTMSMKRRFELREQRATKRMLLIMASFCVCWMPFLVMYVLRGLCAWCSMDQHLVAAIIWLGYVNSSLNPVLYTLFNDDFKAAFKKMVGLGGSPRAGGKQGGRRGRARRLQSS